MKIEDFEMQLSIRFYHDGDMYQCEIIDENDEEVDEPAAFLANTATSIKSKVLGEISVLVQDALKKHSIAE